jgi:hypothetical protein
MKKVLLATTALIAFGAVSANAAEPVKLAIGGYMIENIGVAKNDSGMNKVNFDVQSDVNVNFVGSTKLDNGITVGVEVDTFGSQRNDSRNGNSNCGKAIGSGVVNTAAGSCDNSNTKRSFLTASGGFGALIVGEREDALYIIHNAAPDVGPTGLQDGSWFQWVAAPANHRVYTATNTSRYDDRTNKISYVTPSFYGLAAGASYAPSISLGQSGHTTIPTNSDNANFVNSGIVNGTDFGGDVYGAGLAYTNTFGGVSIKADAGAAQANIANLTLVQGGLQVGYAGFTVGGSILNRHVPNDAHANGLGNALTKTAAYAGQSWDAGVSYTTGPYAVSLGYFADRSKDDGVAGVIGNGRGADSTGVWSLAGAYTMGPGVAWKSSVSKVNYTDGNGGQSAAQTNNGWAVVTGLRVDF